MRLGGWTLLSAGLLVLLYIAYLLFYTGIGTGQAQRELLDRWELEVGDPGGAAEGASVPGADVDRATRQPVPAGEAIAALWFERPGARARPVSDDVLMVVEGSDPDSLTRGPGHYPGTAGPGESGNMAIAGHRTTYGAPFYDVDQVRPGDEIHVMGRDGREHIYVVDKQQVVQPDDTWVIGGDPLGTGAPTLTLTTCYPRFSAAQRLIVFATLRA